MKSIGIWLDTQKAIMVFLNNGKHQIKEVASNVETYHFKGGSRSKTPYGPQQTVSESSFNLRKKKQLNNYFKQLASLAENTESLYVTGPGEVKTHFSKYLKENSALSNKLLKVDTSDSMTNNQLVVKVKDVFGNYNQFMR